jgi:pimeloyl-ACP methyl ester carboxylesterase
MKRIDIDTERLRTSCWVSGPENGTPVLLLHGNLVTDESCPPQPMLGQISSVLERYRQGSGASVREEVLEGAGHGPLIERSERVAELMREVMGLG